MYVAFSQLVVQVPLCCSHSIHGLKQSPYSTPSYRAFGQQDRAGIRFKTNCYLDVS